MKKVDIITVILVSLVISGCSTTGNFKVPDGSELYIYNRPEPVNISADGRMTATKPFFWSAAGGVPYRLEKNGKTIKQGKLQAKFRVVSIFWPPFALIYWPMGLDPSITYDLVSSSK